MSAIVRPLTGARKMIADRMVASLASSAQLTFHAQADISDLLAARKELQASGSAPSVEDCIILAYVGALARFPDMNGTIEGDVLTLSGTVNLAIAMQVEGRLLTPVIQDAGALDLYGVADTRQEILTRARTGAVKVSEMKGGTATISNLGRGAVRHFTPILNSGQLTLLGVGGTWTEVTMTEAGACAPRTVVGLSLTVDHRIVDGEPASRFITAVIERLQTLQLAPAA